MRTNAWRHERVILLCLLAAAPFLLTPWVHGDGIGQFVFLRSAVIDRDLQLDNEYAYLTQHIEEDAGGLPGRLLVYSDHKPGFHPGYHQPDPDPVTGRVPSNWSVGPAVMWAPAYLLADGVVRLGNTMGLRHRSDGYGGLYYLALALTSLVGAALGMLFSYRLTAAAIDPREAFWATVIVAAATSVLYYVYLAPSHSHALTIMTSGAFLLHWSAHRDRATARTWWQWGLLAGLMFVVRWHDGAIAIPALVASSIRAFRRPAPDVADSAAAWKRWSGYMLIGGLGFLLVASVQFAVWQYFHGHPWVRYSVGTFGWNAEGLAGTLLSFRHGLFTWTPVTLLACFGLVRLFRRDRELATVAIGIIVVLVVANCAVRDWWAGTAFGMRRLLSATPVFVLGLAVFFGDARRWWSTWRAPAGGGQSVNDGGHAGRFIAPLVLVVFGLWNVLLVAQFALGMISHTEAVPLSTMASNMPEVVRRLIDLARTLL